MLGTRILIASIGSIPPSEGERWAVLPLAQGWDNCAVTHGIMGEALQASENGWARGWRLIR